MAVVWLLFVVPAAPAMLAVLGRAADELSQRAPHPDRASADLVAC
jgi:hypothetical protein